MQYLISDESLYIGADDFLHIEGDGSTFYHIRNHIERTLRKIDEIVSTVHFMFDQKAGHQTEQKMSFIVWMAQNRLGLSRFAIIVKLLRLRDIFTEFLTPK